MNGNGGPGCGTVNSPDDSAVGTLTVASINQANVLPSFDSRGPSFSGAIGPDLCAPGVQIHSAYSTADNAYATLTNSGSDSSHTGGAVALLRNRNRNLNFGQILQLLGNNTNRDLPLTGQNCGEIPSDTEFPNNVYGYGMVYVYAVFRALDESRKLRA